MLLKNYQNENKEIQLDLKIFEFYFYHFHNIFYNTFLWRGNLKFNDINISIDNVNLTPIAEQEKGENQDIDKALSELENLDQSKKSKYIRMITLTILEQIAEKEGRDFNRMLDLMIFEYIKNHHKNNYIDYVEEINQLSKKEKDQDEE